MLQQYLLIALAASFVLAIFWATFISEFPKARIWQRRREAFLALAKDYGLSLDRDACKAHGQWGGHAFSAGIRIQQGSKSKGIFLWARLELEGCPEGLHICEESLFSGWARALGSREMVLDDPEFDAVFRITGSQDIEAVKAFLTPSLRLALLRILPLLSHGRLAGGALVSEQNFATPLGMEKHFRPLLERYRLFTQILEEQQGRVASGTVERKLRRFAVTNLLICLPLLLVCFLAFQGDNSGEALVVQFGLSSLVVLNFFVFRANQIARVLLQGVYAFLSLATASAIVLALLEFSELLSWRIFRLGEDNAAGFFMIAGAALIVFWGSRHYLRVLHSKAWG